MNYVDEHGQWHPKPVTESNPIPSNDGMIISAYAAKLDLPVNNNKLFLMVFMKNAFISSYVHLPAERTPNKPQPYPSRDFYLGLSALELIRATDMEMSGWNFSPLKLPELSVIKLVKQLWNLRGKHRNTFWREEGYEQVRHVAFSVPIHDRAFYYRMEGRRVPLIYKLAELVDKYLVRKSGDDSSALIRWLKYDQLPEVQVFERYFGSSHPITQARRSL